MKGGRRRNGFTLIELLVVIAVIAILAAILMPALSQARDRARAAVCLNNMKQIGIAIHLYAQDYDGFVPLAGSSEYGVGVSTSVQMKTCWIGAIHPYLAGKPWSFSGNNSMVLACPASFSTNPAASEFKYYYDSVTTPNPRITNYKYNILLGFYENAIPSGYRGANFGYLCATGDGSAYSPRRLDRCKEPSRCGILIDGKCRTSTSFSRFVFQLQDGRPNVAGNDLDKHAHLRHSGGMNVLYADGHVGRYDPDSDIAFGGEFHKSFVFSSNLLSSASYKSEYWPW